ncbi:MAG: hypothetical protein ABI876_10665 [Bacteroidota bacterium]
MENPFGIRSLARGFQVTTPEVQFDTVNGRGPAIISHAHADHVAENPKKPVFASPPTADLLRARGHVGDIEKLEFGQWRDFDGWRLKLLPAGHILGSAQVLVERGDGLRLLYTGDMKTRRGRTCEMAEFEPADDLLTECTFGMPIFRFPPRGGGGGENGGVGADLHRRWPDPGFPRLLAREGTGNYEHPCRSRHPDACP